MLPEEQSQSVIELVVHQLVPLSVASVTLLIILGAFLVAKVLRPFISDFERTYRSNRLYGKSSNEGKVFFVNVQERIKVFVEETSTSHTSDGVSGFKFCGHVQYCYICQQALTELASHLHNRFED